MFRLNPGPLCTLHITWTTRLLGIPWTTIYPLHTLDNLVTIAYIGPLDTHGLPWKTKYPLPILEHFWPNSKARRSLCSGLYLLVYDTGSVLYKHFSSEHFLIATNARTWTCTYMTGMTNIPVNMGSLGSALFKLEFEGDQLRAAARFSFKQQTTQCQ